MMFVEKDIRRAAAKVDEGEAGSMRRIAEALERLSPPPPAPPADLEAHVAYGWDGAGLTGLEDIAAPDIAMLAAIDAQKVAVQANIDRHARGHAAHDMLLWGARGMGKSALVKAAVANAQERMALPGASVPVALVQCAGDALGSLPRLFALLGGSARRFVLFIDDIGFEDGPAGAAAARALRSLLEGGVAARPANVRLAVTSNRRHIVARDMSEQDDPINPRDVVDDRLALADRFGLSIGFHNCSQADYLAIVTGYAARLGLAWDEGEALQWAKARGARSGRVAWQFVTEIAGRAGLAV